MKLEGLHHITTVTGVARFAAGENPSRLGEALERTLTPLVDPSAARRGRATA